MEKDTNYSMFRNKNLKNKLENLLDQARKSKIDLLEEIRCLDLWIKDYEKNTQMFK